MSCFICDKHAGNHEASRYFIFRNRWISVYHMAPDTEKVYQGYVFLEVNRHVESLDELTIEEAEEIGRFQKLIPTALKEKHLVDHVYIYELCDRVSHLHFYLIPRYEGAPKELAGMECTKWKAAPFLEAEELLDYCKTLGRALKMAYINLLADKKIAAGEDGENHEVETPEDREVQTGGYDSNGFFDDEGWDEEDPLDGTPFPRWG